HYKETFVAAVNLHYQKRTTKQTVTNQIKNIMKKSFAIAALTIGAIVLGTNTVQAQDKTTATTTVNITLSDVISIDDGSVAGGGTVAFNYATAADYNSEKTKAQANALKVTSTKIFTVKVKADGSNFV